MRQSYRFLPRWPLPRILRQPLLTACLASILALAIADVLVGCGSASTPVNTAATATAGVAIGQKIDQLTRQAVAGVTQQVQTSYDATQRDVRVQVTVGWTNDIQVADVATEQERVKTICFRVQQALWTNNSLPLHQALVTVLGPIATGYTEQIIDAHGVARMTSTAAASFTWANLTAGSAWNRYDEVYLRADYDPHVGGLPAAPLA
ncbi:MAG TPA: hypothetical protein VF120_17175 [Ktedonobacterales bacterium]